MASTNKTQKLGLNQWLETDKPTRSDFVSDNSIIENAISSHVENQTIHLTQSEKTRLQNPIAFRVYQGNDEQSRSFTLDFEPEFVVVYTFDEPAKGSSGITFGFAANQKGGSLGVGLSGTTLVVKQGTVYGQSCELNRSDCQYCVVAFR